MVFRAKSKLIRWADILFFCISFFMLGACTRKPVHPEKSLTLKVQDYLRGRLRPAGIPAMICIRKERLQASTLVPLFYRHRKYRPAWSRNEVLWPQVESLIKAISKAEEEGLRPSDYHLEKINEMLNEIKLRTAMTTATTKSSSSSSSSSLKLPPSLLAELDLLLTDAFFLYASHLAQGKVNPETIKPEWGAFCRALDLIRLLESAIISNRIEENLRSLLPQHIYYFGLRRALASYRSLVAKGGWIKLQDGPPLKKGIQDERVSALRIRLLVSKDLAASKSENRNLFDDSLEMAVCKFQHRHGLEPTGIVDTCTLAVLNIRAEERMEQIGLNMERWRWLSHDLGKKYALVDIANFRLQVVNDTQTVMNMKIVAGNLAWQTPVFSSQITQIIINPYWNAPKHVLLSELINYMRQDPNYLTNNKMKLLRDSGAEEIEVNPKSINLAEVNEKNLDFWLRQDPGPLNVLGRLKFMSPNKYNVYLHDTPYQEDFGKSMRMFSHGCIRIEKPIDFAIYLLQEEKKWPREKIVEAINKETEQTVFLKKPVDVHVIYGTAWVRDDGVVHFNNDIYKRDKRLAVAFSQKPPKDF